MKLKTYIYKRKPSFFAIGNEYFRINPNSSYKPNSNAAGASTSTCTVTNTSTGASTSTSTNVTFNNNTVAPLTAFWTGSNEICSVSDYQQIYKWSTDTRDSMEVAILPSDFKPTDMHWHQAGDTSLLISSSDGRCVMLNKTFRAERSLHAHEGSINSARWSPDGTGLLTAGEDGVLKIWSRSGMLRSTIIQSKDPIRCARWAPNSSAIVFSQGNHISIRPLAANSKLIKWRAHDSLVLSLTWSTKSNVIVSGGEDCRFKIWDTQGANLFTSPPEEYSITAVEFNADTDLLVVGSFNVLKLCSSDGWTYSTTRFVEEPLIGSVLNLCWSPDGTQIACGTSTGNLIVGYVLDRQMISRNVKVTTTSKKTLLFDDIITGTKDILDFPDRIINFGMGYGYLVVASVHQLHIFKQTAINTPIVVDGRRDVKAIEIGKKFFMVLDATAIWVYTFTGRLHINPRYPGHQTQITNVSARDLSLGLDVLAIRDNADHMVMHIFDLMPTASRQYAAHTIRTKTPIADLAACRTGTLNDQYLVYIDNSRDLYIMESRNIVGTATDTKSVTKIYKIGTQVIAVKWGSDSNILVGLHDSCYSIWYCPGEGSVDPTIIALTTVTIDNTAFGKNIGIETFEETVVKFRCAGTVLPVNVNSYCDILLRTIMEGQWQKALQVCRFARNATLWATMAAIASRRNQLQICQEAYSAALQIDQVCYLKYLKDLESANPVQMAESSLMIGRFTEAETILLHHKKYKEAIGLCLRMHQWKRALEVAEKYAIDLKPLVLEHRREYLKSLNSQETEECYLAANAKPPQSDEKNEN